MSNERDNIQDDQADYLARCLLMPEQIFIKKFYEICSKHIGLHQIAVELGKIFVVETTQAAIRMTELKLHKRTTRILKLKK
ncbi:MAG: hypothetical protein PHT07_21035 [Paludibacter sp.]|nr:hypothetical protein [Paludibacter sp.]